MIHKSYACFESLCFYFRWTTTSATPFHGQHCLPHTYLYTKHEYNVVVIDVHYLVFSACTKFRYVVLCKGYILPKLCCSLSHSNVNSYVCTLYKYQRKKEKHFMINGHWMCFCVRVNERVIKYKHLWPIYIHRMLLCWR